MTVNKINLVVKKNLKQIKRAKLSSLVIIFGPLLIILLAGIAFSTTNLQGVKVGIYSENLNSKLFTDIQEELAKKSFEIFKLNEAECINGVSSGRFHVCLIIEEANEQNGLEKVDERVNNKVIVYGDYSKTRVIWTILGEIERILDKESKDTSYNIIKSASTKITYVINRLNQKENEIDNLIEEANYAKSNLIQVKSNYLNYDNIVNIRSYSSNTYNTVSLTRNELLSAVASIESTTGPTPATSELREIINQRFGVIQSNLNEISNLAQTNYNDPSLQIDQVIWKIDSIINKLEYIKVEFNLLTNEFEGFDETLAEEMINPIPSEYHSVVDSNSDARSDELRFFDYLLPGLMIIVIMFTSILLGATMMMQERKNKAYFRNIMSPTAKGIFIAGTYLTALIIITIQIVILLLMTRLAFNSQLYLFGSMAPMVLILSASLFILIGILIGHIFNSEETSIIASICIGMVSLVSSNMIMSIEAMPVVIGNIMKFTPFVLAETALRKMMIFGSSADSIILETSLLLVFAIILILTISSLQRNIHNKETF